MTAKTSDDMGDFNKFLAEFSGESDRAAVILGSARLEILLGQLLSVYLLPNTDSRDELLEGDGPLSSFHARILTSYRLGLIDANFVKALHLTRRIRNTFAHEGAGCDLNAGPHRDRVKELRKLFANDSQFLRAREFFFKDLSGPSADFRTALAVMTLRLELAVDDTTQISEVNPAILVPPGWLKSSPASLPQGNASTENNKAQLKDTAK